MGFGKIFGGGQGNDEKKLQNQGRKTRVLHEPAMQTVASRSLEDDYPESNLNTRRPSRYARSTGDEQQQSSPNKPKRHRAFLSSKPRRSGSVRDNQQSESGYNNYRNPNDNHPLTRDPVNESNIVTYNRPSGANVGETPRSLQTSRTAESQNRMSRSLIPSGIESRDNDLPGGADRGGPNHDPHTSYKDANVRRRDEVSPSKSEEQRARQERPRESTFEPQQEEEQRRLATRHEDPHTGYRDTNVRRRDEVSPSKSEEQRARQERPRQSTFEPQQEEEQRRLATRHEDPHTGYRDTNVRRRDEVSPSKSEEQRARQERPRQSTFEPQQEEEQRRLATRHEERDCGCKEARDGISRRLYQFKQELPDEHSAILQMYFKREIPRDCSFEDIRMAVDGLIRALQSSNQDADIRKNDFEMKKKECESLKTTRDDLESKISMLEGEKEKERESTVKATRLAMKTEYEEAQLEQQSTWRKKENNYKKAESDYKTWLLELQREVQDLEKECKAQKDKSNAQIRKLETDEETREKKYRDKLVELERAHEEKLARLQEDHKISVTNLNDSINQIKKDCENEKTQMKKHHEGVVEALENRREEEHRSLKEKNQSLRGVLVNRDGYKAMSDYKLASRFQELTTDVDAFARVQWDISRVRTWPFSDKAFVNSENPRMNKQYLFQNTIWVILYERIFFTPFRVLGDKGKSLERQWAVSFGEDRNPASLQAHGPPPTLDSEKWRYEIIKDCLDAINRPLVEGDAYYNVKRDYELSVDEATDDILKELGRVATVTEMNRQNFGTLVRNAAKFWLEVGQERYRLFLGMSNSGGEPSRSGHTAVGRDGSQKLVILPELRRIGDAQGKGLDIDRIVAGCEGHFSQFSSY